MFSLRGFLINTAIFAVGAVPASADDLFFDSFESGDLNTSQNGFEWGGDGSTGNVTVSTERAYSGQHSLRFLFRGKPAGQDSTAEQRFSLGGEFTELWVQ